MVTCSPCRPTTLCARSAVPGFSRTQPEKKSSSSMKDLAGMDHGNHIHGGRAAPHTPCGGKAIKSIASTATAMPCSKKTGKRAGLCSGHALARCRSRPLCHSCFGQNGLLTKQTEKGPRKNIYIYISHVPIYTYAVIRYAPQDLLHVRQQHTRVTFGPVGRLQYSIGSVFQQLELW